MKQEMKEVFGPKVQPEGVVGDAKDDGSDAVNEEMDLHTRFVWEWEKWKPKPQHEYALSGFALSVSPAV